MHNQPEQPFTITIEDRETSTLHLLIEDPACGLFRCFPARYQEQGIQCDDHAPDGTPLVHNNFNGQILFDGTHEQQPCHSNDLECKLGDLRNRGTVIIIRGTGDLGTKIKAALTFYGRLRLQRYGGGDSPGRIEGMDYLRFSERRPLS